MNDHQLELKVRQDAVKVKKDINTLVGDSAARFGRLGENISQATGRAREDINTWAVDGASQFNEGFKKLTSDARETAVEAATVVQKDVDYGLSRYNTKAQEIANRMPGGFGEKSIKYPWVAITVSLFVGLLLGLLLRPNPKPLEQIQI
jgi:ElaB/YqjD/DUF883 family membrane-anchored ribosome-binding protein